MLLAQDKVLVLIFPSLYRWKDSRQVVQLQRPNKKHLQFLAGLVMVYHSQKET